MGTVKIRSWKDEVRHFEEINRELLEACKLALEKLEWAKQRWPQS